MKKLRIGCKGIILCTGESVRLAKVSSNLAHFKGWIGFDEFNEEATIDDESIYAGVISLESNFENDKSVVLLEDFQQDDE